MEYSRLELLMTIALAPVSPGLLTRELGHLHPSQILLDDGRYAVLTFRAEQAPRLMSEVVRLRQICLRQNGEGASEPERTSPSCTQLIAVDRSTGRVMGGYHMSLGERGRSVVVSSWQRSRRGLPLLQRGLRRWQGIRERGAALKLAAG